MTQAYPDGEDEPFLPRVGASSKMSSSLRGVSSRIDTAVQLRTAMHEGHQGEVLSVDASDSGDIIITGGEDNTLRIWRYSPDIHYCYRLVAVLCHAGEVTSVGFVGDTGPVVGGDSTGSFVVWPMDENRTFGHSCSEHRAPNTSKAIRGLEVKKAMSDDGAIIIASASGAIGLLSKAQRVEGSSSYTFSHMATFEHEEDVREICNVPGHVMEGAAVCTCTSKRICLWTADGALMFSLADDCGSPFVDIALSTAEDASSYYFILAAVGKYVALWALCEGRLVNETGEPYTQDESPEPLVRYEVATTVKYVAVGNDNSFLVVAKEDKTTEMFHISPERVKRRAEPLGAHKPASMLVKDLGDSIFEAHHDGEARAIAVFDDTEGEATLLEAFNNGVARCWDLSGVDAGELTVELRSLKIHEVLVPIVLLGVSFFQISSFAFGPATKWSKTVEAPANYTTKIAVLDAEMLLSVDKQYVFWPSTLGTLAAMVVFMLCAALGIWESVSTRRRTANRYHRYACALFYQGLEMLVETMLFVTSTVCVVPMFTNVAGCFDCVWDEVLQKEVLQEFPTVVCWETHHRYLVIATGVIAPLFLVSLVPFFCVQGDAKYIKQIQFFNPGSWRASAERKASCYYGHAMHPDCRYVFKYRLTDLFSKIALPCVTIVLTNRPRLQMAVISGIGLLLFLRSTQIHMLADPIWTAAKQCLQLSMLVAMLCGFATACLPQYREYTTWWLVVSESVVFCIGWVQLQIQWQKREDRAVVVEGVPGELVEDPDDDLGAGKAKDETGDVPVRQSTTTDARNLEVHMVPVEDGALSSAEVAVNGGLQRVHAS